METKQKEQVETSVEIYKAWLDYETQLSQIVDNMTKFARQNPVEAAIFKWKLFVLADSTFPIPEDSEHPDLRAISCDQEIKAEFHKELSQFLNEVLG